MKRLLVFIVLSGLFPIQCVLGSDNSAALDALRHARVITCQFTQSAKADYEDGELKIHLSEEKHELAFDSIDFSNGRARMISTGRQIGAFVTDGGATFFEGPGFDNHSFITVFPVPSKAKGEFVAVDSVHALIPGIKLKTGEHFYVPEQRYGSCKIYPAP
jgi:hypothetical protein